jgi:hypothetical protein
MLLLAEGLFRVDVAVSPDVLRTTVRNLSSGALRVSGQAGGERVAAIAFGDADTYRPSQARVEFTLGGADDAVDVRVLIAILHFSARGTVRVTGQAIVRQPAAA